MRVRFDLNKRPSIPESIDSYSNAIDNTDFTINILAILHIITGLLFIPYIWSIFSHGFYPGNVLFLFLTYFTFGLLVSTLTFFCIIGLAIWKVRSWAWKTSVIVNAICLFLSIMGQLIFPAMLNIILLLMLNNNEVKDVFHS